MDSVACPSVAFDRHSLESAAPPVAGASTTPTSSNGPGDTNTNGSILSKFTSRFGKHNRSISEFYIEPDDPWRTYSSGDLVKGTLVLTVTKPLRITHLVICLHGYVKVFKNAVAPGESAEDSGYLGPGRGRRGGEYLGNGFASLFEDEVVLCGDGRLKEGVYKFRFELCFPSHTLPSSIHFERGTVSYVITATLTRPTTISPTVSCDKRIILLESVDIAPLPAPKPKIITLEPISKKPKAMGRAKSSSADRVSSGARTLDPSPTGSDSRPPLSPCPSEHSNSSCITDSTQSFQIVHEPGSVRFNTSRTDETHQGASPPLPDGTITATSKLLRSGALPGDVLGLHISVQHTKPIRSPHGIIITLYRQGRTDMHPDIPIGTPQKGKKPVFEDYYPKSRTGLGGLSFTATRSSCVFRKDLSQSFSPLIIDPNTMTAEVKTSVRIPEDSFPTITRVPGGMISFRYYVEVVMDLGGKLASQNHVLPRLNMVNSTGKFYPNGRVMSTMDKGRGMVATDLAGNIIDTDPMRREKSVAACVFEVVVGSKDSARGAHRQRNAASPSESPVSSQHFQDFHHRQQPYYPYPPASHHHMDAGQSQVQYQGDPSPYSPYTDPNEYYTDDGYGWQGHNYGYYPPEPPPSQFIPPLQPEEVVDEKTRLKRAEETLLPSRPPGDEDIASDSASATPQATAPPPSDLDGFQPFHDAAYDHYSEYPSNSLNSTPIPSARSVDTLTADSQHSIPSSSSFSHTPAPSYSRPTDGGSVPGYDKLELERQRLLAEASVPSSPPPPESSSDYSHRVNGLQNGDGPSAPGLSEEDLITQTTATGESLPRYQR